MGQTGEQAGITHPVHKGSKYFDVRPGERTVKMHF
jgi:hypothetical protein